MAFAQLQHFAAGRMFSAEAERCAGGEGGYDVNVEPFDPTDEFEELVLDLNGTYWPGSVSSGRTRNELIRAWALCVGRSRAKRELDAAIARHGSRNKLSRALRMASRFLRDYEEFLKRVPERGAIPSDEPGLHAAFDALDSGGQLTFLRVASDLLRSPTLLAQLVSSDAVRVTSLLTTALRSYELEAAVTELARLLDDGVVREEAYQDWCERHSWAFGNAHVLRDEVRRLSPAHIVDMLLPDLLGYRDIVELKRPDADVLSWDRSHRTYYFSVSTSKAIGQVHKYIDRLHDGAREGLSGHPEIVAYHPHARIVIGRSHTWDETKTRALRGLNERLHGVAVMTYDHLLAQARRTLATLGDA